MNTDTRAPAHPREWRHTTCGTYESIAFHLQALEDEGWTIFSAVRPDIRGAWDVLAWRETAR